MLLYNFPYADKGSDRLQIKQELVKLKVKSSPQNLTYSSTSSFFGWARVTSSSAQTGKLDEEPALDAASLTGAK